MLDVTIPATFVINQPPTGTEIPILLNAPFAATVPKITAQAIGATATVDVTLKINGTDVSPTEFVDMDVTNTTTEFTPGSTVNVSAGDLVTLLFESPTNSPLVSVQVDLEPA